MRRALICVLLSMSACSCEEEPPPTPTTDMSVEDQAPDQGDDMSDVSDLEVVAIVARDDEILLVEDGFQLFNLFENDTGTGDLKLASFDAPTLGTLALNSVTKNFRFDPNPNVFGTETLSYTVEDQAGQRADATLTITITPVNDPPNANEDTFYVPETGGRVTPLENDSDVEDDELTLVSAQPESDRITATVEGSEIVITPADGFVGATSLTYVVSDGTDESTGSVTLGIGLEDGAPLLRDDILVLDEGREQVAAVLSNDTYEPGGKVTITTRPRWLEVVAPDNQIQVRAPRGFNGQDTLVYTYRDPQGRVASATLYVTVYESGGTSNNPQVSIPAQGLSKRELAVVINDADPNSIAIGEAYAMARGLPQDNVVRVTLPSTDAVLSRTDFAPIYDQVQAALPEHVQALALAWIAPYRVDCMSITSAFALGFDTKFCKAEGGGCQASAPSGLYDTSTKAPYTDLQIRPTMMLAATSVAQAQELMDRGVASDNTFPPGRGYLIRTTDSNRSVRYPDFERVFMRFMSAFDLTYIDNEDGSGTNTLRDLTDLLFYFTGLTRVADLETLTFRPGAVADHLTSFGGRLTATSGQMSAVRWLEAGATGSFGTVVEPCNYQQKFPRVSVLLDHYYRGDTLVEAYWKSVAWPGEGVFIGEPLARPWGRAFLRRLGDRVEIESTFWRPGQTYELLGSDRPDSGFMPTGETFMFTEYGQHKATFPATQRYYRLE